MRYALKAPLLSGLVLPGIGQIAMKRYGRGIALVLTVLACASVIVVIAVQQALAIVDKLSAAGGAADIDTISKLAAQASAGTGGLVYNIAVTLMFVCWIVGIVDAYRIGRRLDQEASSPDAAQRSCRGGP